MKLFNLDSVSRTATVEAYNQEGVLLGSAVVTLGAKKGKDLELNGSLGLGLPVDSFGQIKVIPSAEKAIVGELLKFKPSSVGSYVDLAKPLPVR